MNRKIKILNIFTGIQGHDGITSVWLDYLKAINQNQLISDQIQMDTVAMDGMYSDDFIETFERYGCTVHRLPNRKKKPYAYFIELIHLIRSKHFDIVHVNGSSAIMAIEMLAAKLSGVKIRIAHCHNTLCNNPTIDKVLRPFFYKLCNVRFACGKDAGKFLFRDRSFEIINNGKNLRVFAFDPNRRKLIRSKLLLENKFVIGHAGSFTYQKNHEYLINILEVLVKQCPDVVLFLMGEGKLQESIKKHARNLGLENNIIFAGHVSNVYDYLQAMDVMAFPSRFEGLPNVLIEWQTNGLPCLISDVITRQCCCTPLVEYLSINEEPSVWAEKLLKISHTNRNRLTDSFEAQNALAKAGFDINENAKYLVGVYTELVSKSQKRKVETT